MRRAVLLSCAAGGLAALITGCGSNGALSLDPVAAAADKTTSQGTARVSLTMTIAKDGRTLTMPGTGVADMKTGDMDLTFDWSQLTKLIGSDATGTKAEEISKDGIVYLNLPLKGLPSGKHWIEVNPKEAAKASGLTQQTGQNPGALVGSLKSAVDEQDLGAETIDGVETTHYRTTVDTAQLLQSASSKAQPWMKSSLAHAPKSVTYDVWVDSGSLIRRMKFAWDTSGSMTLDFTDFGTPIDVQAPTANDVVDGLTLAKNAQSRP